MKEPEDGGCFTCRKKERGCCSSLTAWIRMRFRSGSSDSDSGNLPQGQRGRGGGGGGGGRWIQRLLRSPAGPAAGGSPPEGRQSPKREESPVLIPTFEEILAEQQLFEASKVLIELENGLFGDVTEADALQRHQEDIKKLSADREDLETRIKEVLLQSLSLSQDDNQNLVSAQMKTLTSAVKAVLQEEEQDRLWRHRGQVHPDWRPSNWRKLHDSTIQLLVENRMDNPSVPSSANHTEESSVQADIHGMGRQLKADLLWVVNVLKECYPSDMDICNFYAKLYHKTFSARLRKLADFCLDDKDNTFILRWVNDSYPGILNKPELVSEINVEALGKLLPKEILDPMEENYLNKQQADLMKYISKVLMEAKEKWNNGEEPPTEDECYASPVAYDIIQFINGMVTSAKVVIGDPEKAKILTSKLTDLMQSFKTFQEDVIKHNRANSSAFIKANLGCIKQFSDVLNNKTHLFPDDVRVQCLSVLSDMSQAAHMFLLSPVHKVLKPHYKKVGTDDWLSKNQFEKLLNGIENEIHELKGSSPVCYKELLGQLYQEVVVEYVRKLLRGKVKLKDRERQEKAHATVKENAECLHKLFNKMGLNDEWLRELLIKIAEVLKLQGVPAIQVEIVQLGSAHHDLSEKHVSALLKLKTNLTKNDRKTIKDTLSDARREKSHVDGNVPPPFFSKVDVK